MKTFEYTIKDELGIHARPAGSVKKTKNYESENALSQKTAKTKKLNNSIMMLMSLGVKQGRHCYCNSRRR